MTEEQKILIANKIAMILHKKLPNFYIEVTERKSALGRVNHFYYLKIVIAASNYEINNVKGQYVQDVSLMLDLDNLNLKVQVFGGNGGQSIYLKPDPNDPKEKYLAFKSVKVPFRKPNNNEKAVLDAIGRFADNYLKTLRDNKDRLSYQEIVDYDKLLGTKTMRTGGNILISKNYEYTIGGL
jgi:hypothetical protein